MTALCWERWLEHYGSRGFRVIARSWPGLGGDIAQLRRDPTVIERLGMPELVDHYQTIIRRLSKPPIIIGHGFGGLIAQILLDRGLGAAGVAIASTPLDGSAGLPLPARSPRAQRALPLTLNQFQEAFTPTLSLAEAKSLYVRYAVPGPDRSLFEAAFASVETVDVRNRERAPLLFIAGSEDRMSPPALLRAHASSYQRSNVVTEFKEFPGRTHFVIGQQGWCEVADFALDWALHVSAGTVRRMHSVG